MTAQRPKLLLVVNQWSFFLSHRLPVALEAQAAGYEVHVATADDAGAGIGATPGIAHHAIPLQRGGMNPWADIQLLWALVRLMRRLRPAVVHLVTIKPVVYGGVAARWTGVPGIVMAISGLGFVFARKHGLLQFLVTQLYRWAIRPQHLRVIFQNRDDQAVFCRLSGLRADQAALIAGSGVAVDALVPQPEPDGPVMVTMAARLLHDKGVGEFIAAARLLLAEGLSVQFSLAGEVDLHNPASCTPTELASWRELRGVHVLGHCADVAALFARSHVVVLPSYREGMPKVLLEAAACGRAIVTTDVPGCRDAIEPGVTGLLVPVRDAAALADAIRSLVLNTSQRQSMGAAGRRRAVRDFDVRHVVRRHLEIYAEVMS